MIFKNLKLIVNYKICNFVINIINSFLMRKSFLINFTFIILSFLLFSCISLKKFYYLRQNKKDTTSVNKNAPVPPIYAIRPGDM